MSHIIDYFFQKIETKPGLKSWLWFASLWALGLISVILLTLPFKLLIYYMSSQT